MAAEVADEDVLAWLRQQSAELGRVAVMGTYDYKVSPAVSLLTLRRLQEQVKQQKCDAENRFVTDEISIDDKTLEYITEDYLNGTAKQLQADIENLNVSHHNKSLVLQRAQIYDALNMKVIEESEESEVLKKTMKHSFAVSMLLLKEQMELRALEKELIEIKKKRITLKHKGSVMLAELRSLAEEQRVQKEPREEKVKRVFRYIQKETDTTTVLQNIFQGLVIASKVNWAANPKLKDAVLKAGKDLSDL